MKQHAHDMSKDYNYNINLNIVELQSINVALSAITFRVV
jgi:hypothetical protein